MFLRELHVEHLRAIRSATVHFDASTTLIGENDSGKGSLLRALDLMLGSDGSVRLNPADFHHPRGSDPPDALPRITLAFEEGELVLRVLDAMGDQTTTPNFREDVAARYALAGGGAGGAPGSAPGLPADVWTHVAIDVRGNRPTDPAWAKSLPRGWQQQRMDNFNILVSGGYQAEDLVSDGWTDIIRKLLVMVQQPGQTLSPEGLAQTMELADFQKMEQIRARVDAIVADRATAEALKPWYRQFCKRPCFHDEYLQAFNRPNVTLVDTKGRGVERMTKKGVVIAGVEYPLDCLIFATGFEVGTDYARRAGYELYGRDGSSLTERWAKGVRTLHGMHSRGFPNCFIMGNQQTGFTVNYPHMLSEQSKHIAYIIRHAIERGVRTVEVSEEAEAEWVATIIRLARLGQQFLEDCTPGYYNNEGKPGERSGQNGFYGGGSEEFFRILREWRAAGELAGLELA